MLSVERMYFSTICPMRVSLTCGPPRASAPTVISDRIHFLPCVQIVTKYAPGVL